MKSNLMFLYFLQRKGFLDYKNKNSRDGNVLYLQEKLADSQRAGPDQFYRRFLHLLFFEGFAKPEEKRTADARRALGNIRYLNGGLFLPHRIETGNKNITIPDEFFERLLKLFSDYSWNLNDTPGENDREISPHVLGYIFEKYINQKAFGAYYTRPEITEYLCERTIHQLILDSVNTPPPTPMIYPLYVMTSTEKSTNVRPCWTTCCWMNLSNWASNSSRPCGTRPTAPASRRVHPAGQKSDL